MFWSLTFCIHHNHKGHQHGILTSVLGAPASLGYVPMQTFYFQFTACLNLNKDPPDSISIAEFMSNDKYGRYPLAKARSPFVCGVTGQSYTAAEVVDRETYLAKAIRKRLGFTHEGSEWDRVVALFSLNTVSDATGSSFCFHSLVTD